MKKLLKRSYFTSLSRRLRALITLSMFLCINIMAQNINVQGIVTSKADGIPLPGVNVVISGTTQGTITDSDGKYSIEAPSDAELQFSYIGYVIQTVKVAGKTTINISMEEESTKLDEVMVIGYGVQQKKLVTGATVQVKNEEFVRNNVIRLESSLQGLTPGMVIVKQSGQPGSDYNINIRGLGSINNNNPLVLIDGVPGNLNTVNPSDIETVDVLKDAASAAIYGSRASNGVILITTKKGKPGEPEISYDAYYGVSNATKLMPVLNARQYVEILNEGYYNTSMDGTKPPFTQADIDYYNANPEGTNWQELAHNDNAPVQSHYLGINGGNDMSNYSVSLSYTKEEGVFNYEDKSNFERVGIRVNSQHKVKKYLTFGENFTFTAKNIRGLGVGNQYDNFMRSLLSTPPTINAYDNNYDDGFGRSKKIKDLTNPLAWMHYYNNDLKKNNNLTGDIYFEVEIIKNLKFKSDFGTTLSFDYNTDKLDTFHINSLIYNSPYPWYSQYMERNFTYNFDNILTYETSFDKNNIMIMLGTNAQDNKFFNIDGTKYGFLSNTAPVLTNVTDIDTIYLKGDFGMGDSRYSYFGRISYNYDQKYLFNTTLRRDVSSRFGPNNRVGYFPSFSAGWVISQESFMSALTWLDFLKIRASWGQNGKEPDQPYQFLATVGGANRQYVIGNSPRVGMSPDIMPNPDLKWESATQTDIGFDSRFLENIYINFDFYYKNTKDWITPSTVAGITGIAGISTINPYINGGNVINKGVELDVRYTKNFSALTINVGANASYNKNLVTEVPDSIIYGSASVIYNGSPIFYRVEEGFPIGYFIGYQTDGLFQNQEEIDSYLGKKDKPMQPKAVPGDVKRIDTNGDSIIDAKDMVMIGNPHPDFIYGLNLSLSFKGIDLSMNFQGAAGHQIVMAYRPEERDWPNYTTLILDRWHGEGTSDRIPRITGGTDPNQNWMMFSDLYIYDADYLRLKSINIGYDFKYSLLKNTAIKQFRIYVSATNLLTFTKYPGLDPEVGYGSYYDDEGRLTDGYASGIDIGFYPASKSYILGINLKF